MATDPNKKTLRHFQCRDYLWETFEQLSAELECSVDYLINEAMRQYARSRQAGGRVSAPPAPPTPATAAPSVAPTGRPAAPAMPAMPAVPAAPARSPAIPSMPTAPGASPKIPSLPGTARPPMGTPATPAARPGVPAIPPLRSGPGAPAAPPPVARAAPSVAPPPVNNAPRVPAMPAAPPPAAAPLPAMPGAAPRAAAPVQQQLVAIFENQDYPVTKEEFIIGRGQKTSDLCIRDSNVSRRHAVVVLHNGQYWMVDQQSTNGVEFLGAKIDRKRIDHGDVFKICDYEVTFVYR